MSDFVSFVKFAMGCGTLMFVTLVILASLPQSKLRSMCLEAFAWAMTAGLALLVISPIDFLPDVIPVIGWADDLGYVVGAFCSFVAAIKQRQERPLLP